MSLDNKVLVEKDVLTTLANKAYGENHTPQKLTDIVDALGPSTQYFNNPAYGHSLFTGSTSSAYQGVVLPDGVTFKDIVFAVGIGGYNNSSVSSRSANHLSWIYCPAIYNKVVADDPIEKECFGFIMGNSGTTYEGDVWTPDADDHYGTGYRTTLYTAENSSGKLCLYGHIIQGGELKTYNSYILAKYGSVVIYYRKGE